MQLPKEHMLYTVWLSWFSGWGSYPVFIKICLLISLLALLGIALAVADIYLWRTAKKKKEAHITELTVSLRKLLMNAVVLNTGSALASTFDTSPFYKFGIHNKDVRKVLVAEMISYRNYFSGDIAWRIRGLYLALGLDKQAKKNLLQKNWETKVYALTELFKMDVVTDQHYLKQLQEHKNKYIRDYARLSLIKFTAEDPLEIIRAVKEPISQWESFEIFFLFQHKLNYTLTSLEQLLDIHREHTVVSLCLQLAVYFKDAASVPLILALLQTTDLKLRAQAVAALGSLQAAQAEHHLVAIYHDQPKEIQLEILTSLGKIKTDRQLVFLENQFFASDDYEIKKHASDAIIKLYPLSRQTIEGLFKKAGELNHTILNHSLNPLINAL